MSTAQTLLLGAIAGSTIFLGLPIGRMQNVGAPTKAFLASIATGILIFLLWDVLSGAVEPIEEALTGGRDGRFLWLSFLLLAGFTVGLMSLVYYDVWMKRRRRKAFLGPGAASTAPGAPTTAAPAAPDAGQPPTLPGTVPPTVP